MAQITTGLSLPLDEKRGSRHDLSSDEVAKREQFAPVPDHVARAMAAAFAEQGFTLDTSQPVARTNWRSFTKLALAILRERDMVLAFEDHTPDRRAVLKLAEKLFGDRPREATAKAKAAPSKPPLTITGLFDHWRTARLAEGGAPSSAKRWAGPVKSLVKHLGHDDAHTVEPEDILRWRDATFAAGGSRETFAKVHLPAVRTIYNWSAPIRWPGSNLMHSGLVGDV